MDISGLKHWVEASKAGDQTAWNYIYHYSHPRLLNIALKICGNTPEAKDAVQDTYVIAYLKLAQLKEASSFLGWISKICTNCCYHTLKSNPSNMVTPNVPIEKDIWWENIFDQIRDTTASQAQIFDAMSNLSETLRTTLLLRYYTSYHSYESISQILSIPVGTVRSRLNQAKLKMNEFWKVDEDINEQPFLIGEEWNGFYRENFGMLHHSDIARNTFLNHLDDNVRIIVTSGNVQFGRKNIEKEIDDDLVCGTTFGDLNIISSDNISILEVYNINSVDYPNRCPETSIFVFSRNKNKVYQTCLHNSA